MARQKNDGRGRLCGRSKGTLNKITQTTKEWIQKLIDDNQEQIRKDLKMLQPKDRVNALLGLLPYVVPKQMSTAATVAIERLTDEEIDNVATSLLNSIQDENTINED